MSCFNRRRARYLSKVLYGLSLCFDGEYDVSAFKPFLRYNIPEMTEEDKERLAKADPYYSTEVMGSGKLFS